MRTKRLLLVILLSVLPMLAFSADKATETEKHIIYSSIYDATYFQKLTKNQRVIYVTGLYDGLRVAQAVTAGQGSYTDWFMDLQTKKINNDQIEAIISKYLSDHPEEWHEPFNFLCVDALYEAWSKMQGQNQ